MTRKKRLLKRREWLRSARQALKSGELISYYGFRFARWSNPKTKRAPPELTGNFPKLK